MHALAGCVETSITPRECRGRQGQEDDRRIENGERRLYDPFFDDLAAENAEASTPSRFAHRTWCQCAEVALKVRIAIHGSASRSSNEQRGDTQPKGSLSLAGHVRFSQDFLLRIAEHGRGLAYDCSYRSQSCPCGVAVHSLIALT